MKELKQLQIKPRKNSEAPTGFKPMTSTILVQYALQTELLYEASLEAGHVREFNLYLLYEEN